MSQIKFEFDSSLTRKLHYFIGVRLSVLTLKTGLLTPYEQLQSVTNQTISALSNLLNLPF